MVRLKAFKERLREFSRSAVSITTDAHCNNGCIEPTLERAFEVLRRIYRSVLQKERVGQDYLMMS